MRRFLFVVLLGALYPLPGYADISNEDLKAALQQGDLQKLQLWDELGLLKVERVGQGNTKFQRTAVLHAAVQHVCSSEAFRSAIDEVRSALSQRKSMDSYLLARSERSPKTLKILGLLEKNGFTVPKNAALIAGYYGCARDVIRWYAARSETSSTGRVENSEEFADTGVLPYGGVGEFRQIPVLVRMLTLSGDFGGFNDRDYAIAQGSWLSRLDSIDTLYDLGVRADEPFLLKGEKVLVTGIERGTTALHVAARTAMSVQERGLAMHLLERSLAAQGNVSARTTSGRTPLWFLAPDQGNQYVGACCEDTEEFNTRLKHFVDALAKKGADLGAKDSAGRTLVEALASDGFTGYAKAMKTVGVQ